MNFKKAVHLLIDKKHLTFKGKIDILQCYHDMKLINQNSKARENMIIDEYWLIGFTEGYATFNSNKLKPKIKYENHIKELELFKSILNNLKHGNLYTSDRKSAGSVILEINNINILMNRIIPIFSKGMLTKKSLDFEDWSMIVKITYSGYHTLDEGKELIHLIKSNMNNFRLNPDFLTNYDKNKALMEQKLNYLLSLPSPYEVKEGIYF